MTAFAVERHTKEWVTAGLISPAQARSLEEFEAIHHSDQVPASSRLGPVAEAAAFVGTVLAMIGALVGLAPQWGRMPLAADLAIAGAIALGCLVAGRALVRMGEPGTARLGGFVRVAATAGVGLVAGTLADAVRSDSPWIAVAGGFAAAATGGLLWWNRDRPLQMLTLAAGAAIATGGVVALLDGEPWYAAAPASVAGAALWLATQHRTVRPPATARALGAVGLVAGALMWADLSVRLGAWLGLAAAIAVVLLGIRSRATAVLAVGVIAALVAVQMLVQTTFHGPAGGAVVALAGLAVVVAIVFRSGLRRPSRVS